MKLTDGVDGNKKKLLKMSTFILIVEYSVCISLIWNYTRARIML